jgi:choline dehydrogenase-like flavoprotein
MDYVVDRRDQAQLRRGLVASARILRAAGAREMVAVGTPAAWHADATDGDAGDRDFAAYLERLAAFSFAPNRGTVVSAHQMGSVRAGAGAADHACDPWGRVRVTEARPGRDAVVPGLWVGDASLLPTAVGVNPMVTTMAIARRVARAIAAQA